MLIIRAYINTDEIDQIYVHNQGETDKEGIWEYRVYHESIPENITITVQHCRKDGYLPLLEKAVRMINTHLGKVTSVSDIMGLEKDKEEPKDATTKPERE